MGADGKWQMADGKGQEIALAQQISALHAAYQRESGQRIAMNMFRERCWYEWLVWRTGNPFTISDVIIVCRYLRTQVLKGDRNPGALKFSNLIQDADRFEEDLQLAVQFYRPRTATRTVVTRTATPDGNVTERRSTSDGTQAASKPVSEVALEMLRKCKESIKP